MASPTMTTPAGLPIAKSERPIELIPRMANRHGLIAGATGTGKTVTLRMLAERFSAIGVPVFLADVKGDLSGIAKAGGDNPKIVERAAQLGVELAPAPCPVAFWDLLGAQGHPARTTVSEMGPLLLARLLGLNETQAGVLGIVFQVADDGGLLLLDLKDLRAMLEHVGSRAAELKMRYGNVSAASVGAIQRGLLTLEQQGGEHVFGEPALDLDDLRQTGAGGQGVVNILAADQLMQSPALYSTFLLWLLAELFERLPEVGDPDKPTLVFFFDEAHLLFEDAPKALVDQIERVVRLIRSKGVGVYFVTQSPLDLPESVLGQLGNRVQHALRAFTPKDQKAVKTVAETMRANPALDAVRAVTELGVGEALVSLLDEKGRPAIVERAFIVPPGSHIGPLDEAERKQAIRASALAAKYEKTVDRESAYEKLTARTAQTAAPSTPAPAPAPAKVGRQAQTVLEAATKSAVRAIGSELGRQIIRGVLGSILGTGRRR